MAYFDWDFNIANVEDFARPVGNSTFVATNNNFEVPITIAQVQTPSDPGTIIDALMNLDPAVLQSILNAVSTAANVEVRMEDVESEHLNLIYPYFYFG